VWLLVGHRARNRPGRWLLTAVGIAAVSAYGGAILTEATIAGDKAARGVLRALPASERVLRVTTSDALTPAIEHTARSALRRLGFSTQTEVVLLNPVRLGMTVVRPAAIDPLPPWVTTGISGRCRPGACPMLAVGAASRLGTLEIPGLRVPVVARTQLGSAAPLGFSAGGAAGGAGAGTAGPPVLLTGDARGLARLGALDGIYRTHSWFSLLSVDTLHSWQLAPLQARLERVQAELAQSGADLTLSAPFAALATARRESESAPGRLLLLGGGAIAVLALFLALAAGTLRQDQVAELARLRAAGALSSTLLGFVIAEAASICAVGVLAGSAVAVTIGAVLAHAAGVPAGAALSHSLLTPSGAAALGLGWLGASGLVVLLLTQRRSGLADAAALASVAALALALAGAGGGDSLTILLAPLACLAGGVLVARAGARLLRTGERLARAGPATARLAFVGLARAPLVPSLAIAFLTVGTAIGGFALAYRATLLRGAADQAADRVPLDALVAASPDFIRPLEVASLTRWRALAGGPAFEVRRTDATYVAGAASATIPALGVPAGALRQLHGWRPGDASMSLEQMSRALAPLGPSRTPGPMLPSRAHALAARLSGGGLGLGLTADLRSRDGTLRQLTLGPAGAHLHALIPRGRWELQALELHEPIGLEITAGHQNGENIAAATQSITTVSITGLEAVGNRGRSRWVLSLRHWRAHGAATGLRPGPVGTPGAGSARFQFATSGAAAVLRPEQPGDLHPIPVLVDPVTAAAADASGNLELTVDGAPVATRVAAVLKRFPTVPSGSAGFVVADEAHLAGALDAWLPGQGRSDELWISSTRPVALSKTLHRAPYSQLASTMRIDVERALQAEGVTRAVQGSLLAVAALSALLALIGVLVSMLGSAEHALVSADLAGQGLGARALRSELRLRALFTGVAGCLAGFVLALALAPLAVGVVRAAAHGGDQRPPLVAVTPWAVLVLWCVIMLGATLVAASIGMLGRRDGTAGGA
jgi:hypothetical protein